MERETGRTVLHICYRKVQLFTISRPHGSCMVVITFRQLSWCAAARGHNKHVPVARLNNPSPIELVAHFIHNDRRSRPLRSLGLSRHLVDGLGLRIDRHDERDGRIIRRPHQLRRHGRHARDGSGQPTFEAHHINHRAGRPSDSDGNIVTLA